MADVHPGDIFTLHRGSGPLLVSLPHDGSAIPDALKARMTPAARAAPDTDWHVSRLYAFARDLGASVTAWPPPPGREVLLVNSTPVGTWPNVDASPLPGAHLGQRIVCDLVYNPEETQLLRDAAAQGCVTVGGLGMLVEQAHEQFRQWTRIDEPAGAFVHAARVQLARRRMVAETENV